MTARYQVRPQSIDQCKQAINNLVEYVKINEKGTLYYIAKQEILNPYAFLHTMIFIIKTYCMTIKNYGL